MNKKADDDRPYVVKSCKQRKNDAVSQKKKIKKYPHNIQSAKVQRSVRCLKCDFHGY